MQNISCERTEETDSSVIKHLCSEWKARCPVAMPTTMFVKILSPLILVVVLSFLLVKEGKVEAAIGEFDFPYRTLGLYRLYVSLFCFALHYKNSDSVILVHALDACVSSK